MQPRVSDPDILTATLQRVALVLVMAISCLTVPDPVQAKTLTLDEALHQALDNNPTLVASGERVAVSRAAVSVERSQSRIRVAGAVVGQAQEQSPEMPATNGFPARRLGESDNGYIDVSAEKLLYSSGKVENSIRQVAYSSSAEQLRHQRLVERVALDTKSAYYGLLAAQRNAETANEEVASTEKHSQIAQTRLKADTAPKFDVIRADVQLAEAKERLLDAQNAVAISKQVLLTAMGRPDLQIDNVACADATLKPQPLQDLLALALSQRTDLLAAKHLVQAAQAGLGRARAENKPSVKTLAGYRSYATQTPLQLDGWYAWLGVGLPVFDGGYASARRDEARSTLTEAEANARAVENAVILDVKRSYLDFTSATAKESVALGRVGQAEEAYRLATLRYESGLATSVEVTDAQSALTRARNDLTNSRLDISTASARLESAVGKQLIQPGGND